MNAITSSTPATRVLNIAAYKFVQLDALERRRRELLQRCRSLKLRGTILLSPEGINLFLAGPPDNVAELLEHLRADPAFSDLETKDSYSDSQPFRRMLVRLKKEIIAFGVDSVRPVERTSPKLPPEELRAWLDAGRPVRLLDVRNDYEFDLGTFDGAEQLNIGNFRDFPQAIKQLPEAAKREPLVMFCTGGIRCEKAGPLLEQEGFEQVYQLDGGILKYFEQC
ncbi:MAG: pseudouridine synthase, partial [Planctomycetales bacterium]|nr:pseudouridine synthase [Planctomycetales bacterium]